MGLISRETIRRLPPRNKQQGLNRTQTLERENASLKARVAELEAENSLPGPTATPPSRFKVGPSGVYDELGNRFPCLDCGTFNAPQNRTHCYKCGKEIFSAVKELSQDPHAARHPGVQAALAMHRHQGVPIERCLVVAIRALAQENAKLHDHLIRQPWPIMEIQPPSGKDQDYLKAMAEMSGPGRDGRIVVMPNEAIYGPSPLLPMARAGLLKSDWPDKPVDVKAALKEIKERAISAAGNQSLFEIGPPETSGVVGAGNFAYSSAGPVSFTFPTDPKLKADFVPVEVHQVFVKLNSAGKWEPCEEGDAQGRMLAKEDVDFDNAEGRTVKWDKEQSKYLMDRLAAAKAKPAPPADTPAIKFREFL